jgi:hypothetical protein
MKIDLIKALDVMSEFILKKFQKANAERGQRPALLARVC